MVDPDVLTAIAAACQSRKRLRFSYLSHERTPSERMAVAGWRYTLAIYLGLPGFGFRADSPPELAGRIRDLVARYQRSVG